MAHSLVHPDYDKKIITIERRKERFQKKIEDLQLDAAVLDQKIMQFNQKIDKLRNAIPLASYQPFRVKLDSEFQMMQEERDKAYKQLLDIKSEIATIIYNIEEMDLEVSSLSELVGATDN